MSVTTDARFEEYFHTGLILHQLPVIILGIYLYYVVKEIENERYNKIRVLVISGVVVVIFLIVFILLHMNKWFLASPFIAGLIFGWIFMYCSIAVPVDFGKKVVYLYKGY